MKELEFEPVPIEQRTTRSQSEAKAKAHGSQDLGRIGVLVLDAMHQFAPNLFASQVRGLQLAAAEHGLEIVLAHAKSDHASPDELFSGLELDGVVVIGSAPAPWLDRVAAGRPRVWLNSHHEAAGDAVLAGNQQIGAMAADYLLSRGHQRLGFFCTMANLPPYPTRLAAFRVQAALAQPAVEVDAFTFQTGGPAEVDLGGLEAMQSQIARLVDRWLEASPRPTGLFVPNDMMTAMLYAELIGRSIQPGRDVEIISCNNELTCLVGIRPRPATIDIGGQAIGARAIEQLIWRINHPDDRRQAQLAIEPLLIEGQVDSDRWIGASDQPTTPAEQTS